MKYLTLTPFSCFKLSQAMFHLTDDPIPINPIFARSVWKLSKIHRPDGFIEDKGEVAAV